MLHVRTGIEYCRVHSLETSNLELICSEITIQKEKWIVYCIYRPPDSNFASSFKKLSMSLKKALDVYGSVIIMGYANIDTLNNQNPSYNSLNIFHYSTKKRKHSFHIMKVLFSSDTRQSMKRRITTERRAEIYTRCGQIQVTRGILRPIGHKVQPMGAYSLTVQLKSPREKTNSWTLQLNNE